MAILRFAKRVASAFYPSRTSSYEQRIAHELQNFRNCENVHDLPEIFHYWSNKYLVPMQQPFGFTNPHDFFFHFLREALEDNPATPTRIASIGSGNSELEVQLAERLIASGFEQFQIDCIDINTEMHHRGQQLAEQKAVQGHVNFVEADFNFWKPAKNAYLAILANQSLHHVQELEHLFGSVSTGLTAGGRFLVSDMIGRNGHQRWPEAMGLIHQFWNELPMNYRFNQQMSRMEELYINHDCSTSGFEGIRAQDILRLLVERFNFEFFLPYGNIIFPFVDRSFGHNFDAEAEWDRDFIDRVHLADEAGMLSGHLKPTSLLAVLRNEPVPTLLRDPRLTPENCIRCTDSPA
jgi:SAM-dependent methyltransferase